MIWLRDAEASSLYIVGWFLWCEPNYDLYLKKMNVEFGVNETFTFSDMNPYFRNKKEAKKEHDENFKEYRVHL